MMFEMQEDEIGTDQSSVDPKLRHDALWQMRYNDLLTGASKEQIDNAERLVAATLRLAGANHQCSETNILSLLINAVGNRYAEIAKTGGDTNL